MAVPIKVTVQKKVGSTCNAVTQIQHVEFWDINDTAPMYTFDTDATGFIRIVVETSPYHAYVNNNGKPCATCRTLVNVTFYNQPVTLCVPCAK